jgi:4-hydroxybenzoate polyprenyltransferase
MGFLVVSSPETRWWQFAVLALSSAAMYSAGMALNDVFDFDDDLQLRPFRPLPSRRISRPIAAWLGHGLLLFGVALAAAVGLAASSVGNTPFRSGTVALLLAVVIWLYDGALKKTFIGPWLMGGCRLLNVLLGMSAGAASIGHEGLLFGYTAFQLAIAGGIGMYIAGVTWFARREAEHSSRVHLGFGLGLMVLGVTLIGAAPRWIIEPLDGNTNLTSAWPLILFLLTFPILRRCLLAIAKPAPGTVQAAVKLSIHSLIVLDAAVILLTGHWSWAVAVLALLIPTVVLGKWVYST